MNITFVHKDKETGTIYDIKIPYECLYENRTGNCRIKYKSSTLTNAHSAYSMLINLIELLTNPRFEVEAKALREAGITVTRPYQQHQIELMKKQREKTRAWENKFTDGVQESKKVSNLKLLGPAVQLEIPEEFKWENLDPKYSFVGMHDDGEWAIGACTYPIQRGSSEGYKLAGPETRPGWHTKKLSDETVKQNFKLLAAREKTDMPFLTIAYRPGSVVAKRIEKHNIDICKFAIDSDYCESILKEIKAAESK